MSIEGASEAARTRPGVGGPLQGPAACGEWTVRPYGDGAVLVEAASTPSAAALAAALAAHAAGLGVSEVVPAEHTVLVVLRDGMDAGRLRDWLSRRPRDDSRHSAGGDVVVIESRYIGEDLARVAELSGLAVVDVVARHTAKEYLAAFAGFAPGFVYLTGLDAELRAPRLSSPRTRVPGGSVAVAARYAAVYPRPGPGGWNLLGVTDAVLFDVAAARPARIQPGDRVVFRSVGATA